MRIRISWLGTRRIVSFLIALVPLLARTDAAEAFTHQVLYNFCSSANCADGGYPNGRLTMDANGNLYGATIRGGSASDPDGYGTIFELVKGTGTYTYNVLWRFSGGVDGEYPNGSLVVDGTSIFGTTTGGGQYGHGIVFKVYPVTVVNHTVWKIAILHAFCKKGGICPDGGEPLAGLSYYGMDFGAQYDDQQALYGTASTGGAYGGGVVFRLRGPNQKYKVVASFGAPNGDVSRAYQPAAELAVGAGGILYGSTQYGISGSGGNGAKLFFLKPRSHSPQVFLDFCDISCYAGGASVALDSNGTSIWYTAAATSDQEACVTGGVTVEGFVGEVVDPTNPQSSTQDYPICSPSFGHPSGRPLLNGSYGTTQDGGNGANGGAVFARDNFSFFNIHSFCLQTNCIDGEHPTGGVVGDQVVGLFGATTNGGVNGAGTIYMLTK